MGDILVLDIETAPDEMAVQRKVADPPMFSAPSNYKDPAKIEAYVAERAASWAGEVREKAALSPTTGRVVAVGLWGLSTPAPEVKVEADFPNYGEPKLLDWAQGVLAERRTVVTFNGSAFDLPFLRARFLKYGIPIPRILLPQPRYKVGRHVDLREWLTAWNNHATGTLEDWCFALVPGYVGHKGGLSGEDVAHLVQVGEWEVLRGYCRRDVEATKSLFVAVGPLLDAARAVEVE